MKRDTDSLIIYILVWTAFAIAIAVAGGLFFGIMMLVAKWVAG
jgi:hypothetical protein